MSYTKDNPHKDDGTPHYWSHEWDAVGRAFGWTNTGHSHTTNTGFYDPETKTSFQAHFPLTRILLSTARRLREQDERRTLHLKRVMDALRAESTESLNGGRWYRCTRCGAQAALNPDRIPHGADCLLFES